MEIYSQITIIGQIKEQRQISALNLGLKDMIHSIMNYTHTYFTFVWIHRRIFFRQAAKIYIIMCNTIEQ